MSTDRVRSMLDAAWNQTPQALHGFTSLRERTVRQGF